MKYAQNTSVSCERSKSEIEATLIRYGADQFASMWAEGKAAIQFRAHKKIVRFILPLPNRDDFKTRFDGRIKQHKEQSPEAMQIDWEQACRQRWRALALAIKAKLEAVECEITTFEEEFLAHIVIPGTHGKTIGDQILPKLEHSYETNKALSLEWEGTK